MAKHNKKRNVGLLHEQLVRYVSEKIVEQKQGMADNAMSIVSKHFNKNSELYKEFRLFNSLVNTKVETRRIAEKIVLESKKACRVHDSRKLMSEKSNLIKDINHNISDKSFYNKKVANYKIFATVQTLLNEWRGSNSLSPTDKVKYEERLLEWMTSKAEGVDLLKVKNSDPLVLNLMVEKFNKKYKNNLSSDQASILEAKLCGDESGLYKKIDEVKNKAIKSLNDFYKTCDNKYLISKKPLIESKINSLQASVSDITVERTLELINLIDELESSDD